MVSFPGGFSGHQRLHSGLPPGNHSLAVWQLPGAWPITVMTGGPVSARHRGGGKLKYRPQALASEYPPAPLNMVCNRNTVIVS